MPTGRRFCRFTPGSDPISIHEIPEDGFCLSAFLIATHGQDPHRVLLGQLDPSAAWDQIGALTPDRVAAHADGWLLPACQLIYGEAPNEAAARIVREQLGGVPLQLGPPTIVSEVYAPRRRPNAGGHWDLEFVYRARCDEGPRPIPTAWKRLEFVDVRKVRRIDFRRSHDEILEGAGLPIGSPQAH
jgi:ADP-ribose pyrophosphatase YjhB (NUDIX family)